MEAPKLQGSKTNKHNFDKYIFQIKKKNKDLKSQTKEETKNHKNRISSRNGQEFNKKKDPKKKNVENLFRKEEFFDFLFLLFFFFSI